MKIDKEDWLTQIVIHLILLAIIIYQSSFAQRHSKAMKQKTKIIVNK